MVRYRPEVPADGPAIEALLDIVFGPDRGAKASYAFRRGVPPLAELGHVATVDGRLVATIRYWPIAVGTTPALLLGPIGVEPALQGQGIGRRLINDTVALAHDLGHRAVFLVGDPAYYGPLGFVPAAPHVAMPDEAPERLQGRSLDPTLPLPSGTIRRAPLALSAAG